MCRCFACLAGDVKFENLAESVFVVARCVTEEINGVNKYRTVSK